MSRRIVCDLVRLFDSLPVPTAEVGLGRFCAQPIPGFPACAVGKDISQRPVLLIQAENTSPGGVPPLVYEHLSVIHLVNCRVQSPDRQPDERTLSVIRCTGDERPLHEYFLRALSPVVEAFSTAPSQQEVSRAIEHLVELFRQLAIPPHKTIQGLWAELFLIARAREPETLIRCWHSMPEERFDFVKCNERLEVKTASSRIRSHTFGLEQLRPPTGTSAIVASVLMERTNGGVSAFVLVEEIRNRVDDPALLVQLDTGISRTLGSDWRHADEARFDRHLAEESLRFFDARNVPAVSPIVPTEVSDIHFRVDLSAVRPLALDVLPADSLLFASSPD